MTPTEFRMLKVFTRHAGQLLTYSQLLEQIWDCEGKFVDKHTLAVNINRLRKKNRRCRAQIYFECLWDGVSMVEKIMMILCLLAVILMWCKNQKLKKDIYDFEENLEQCLDLLVSGNSIEKFSEIDDSFWNKIYEKLRKLHRIWEQQNQKSMK